MCGICGFVYSERSRPASEQRLLMMRDSLTHRGPDDAGNYLAPGIALGSRRLAILDLSERGHMPMSSPDGRHWITYNGEVYNYRELRAHLEARGHKFHSNTDTEVVLALYLEEGTAALDRLNGMFAFAIWDSVERTLFLARDRIGVKPLYYTLQDDAFLFASEEKALFAAGISPQFDRHTWEELLCFRYVAGERTPYVGIKRLLPGHYLLWRDGQVKTHRWWNLGERARHLRENLPSDPYRWYQENFDSAVELRRISDVPVGVLLSGGLDSGSVAASLAARAGSGVASFTVRFAEPGYDEGPLAQTVVDRYRLQQHQLEVSSDKLKDLLLEASRLNDEPLVHGNDIHLLAISRYAKPRVTVLLSGEGGDETLGGYVRYAPLKHPLALYSARPALPSLVSLLKMNGRMRKLSRFLALGSIERFILFNACDVLPQDLDLLGAEPTSRFPYREMILDEAKTLYPKDYVRQAMYSDQHTFINSILDRNDRMTMGASIECRVPFLDYRLVEMLAALPSSVVLGGKQSKHVLRRSLGGRLPEAVRRHRKWGFGVPWNRYLRDNPEMRDLVRDLPNLEPIKEGPLDRSRLTRMVENFLSGSSSQEALIKGLVMMAVWYQACFPHNKAADSPPARERFSITQSLQASSNHV